MSKTCPCLKYLIFIFNFVFFLIGCTILGIGIWLKVESGEYVHISQYDYLSAANAAIAIGAVILVISFFGCCGSIKEIAPMLIAFFVLLVIIFLLEISVGIYAYVNRTKLEGDLKQDLTQAMLHKYGDSGEKDLTKAVDDFQMNFQCCGIDIYTDWRGSNYYRKNGQFPPTCCIEGSSKSCPSQTEVEWHKVYKIDGCYIKLRNFLKENFLYIGATFIIFAIFQVLGMIFSMLLYRSIR